MKLKHLQSALEAVRVFDEPSIELEQYPTPPHLAAQIALAMRQHGDVEGRAIGGQRTNGRTRSCLWRVSQALIQQTSACRVQTSVSAAAY